MALLGLAFFLMYQRESAARDQAQVYAEHFADRLSEATEEKIPREAEIKRVARRGCCIDIQSYPEPVNGATLYFQAISLPFAIPLGYSTVKRCYTATMSIGHPVELTEIDCY